MGDKWTLVEILRHTRHDWLNRLQLIKGNIALGKVDQANRIIEEIVQEVQQEAKLSNLELSEFIETLLTHNWEVHHFKIEYEILDMENPPVLDDKKLAHWIRSFFAEIDRSASPISDNCLYITMDLSNRNFRFLFEFNGIIENAAELKKWLEYGDSYPSYVSFEHVDEAEYIIEAIFK